MRTPTLLIRLFAAVGLLQPVRDWRRDRRFRARMRVAERLWRAAGCPVPPPDSIKHRCIRDHARKHRCQVLVETGTFHGDTIFAMRREFRELHSIELAPALHSTAVREMTHLRHVHLHLGDSAALLPDIDRELSGATTLFWLDGHFCAGPSARGSKDTPILEELGYLLSRAPRTDVVLIDDARLFTGNDGYPSLASLEDEVRRQRPAAAFSVDQDIVRIVGV